MEREIFYAVTGSTVEIGGRTYVSSESAEKLVDTDTPLVRVNFVRRASFEWFPDDPVRGGEMFAFRNSVIEGPYFSMEEAKEAEKRLSVKRKNEEPEYDVSTVRTSIISKVLPGDIVDSEIIHYTRNSLYLGINTSDIYMHFSEHKDKLRRVFEDTYKSFSENSSKQGQWTERQSSIHRAHFQIDGIGFINANFSSARLSIDDVNFWSLQLDSFGGEKGKDIKDFFDGDPAKDLYEVVGSSGDSSFSSEDFVTFNKVDLSKTSSLGRVLKAHGFIPGKLESLGKM